MQFQFLNLRLAARRDEDQKAHLAVFMIACDDAQGIVGVARGCSAEDPRAVQQEEHARSSEPIGLADLAVPSAGQTYRVA